MPLKLIIPEHIQIQNKIPSIIRVISDNHKKIDKIKHYYFGGVYLHGEVQQKMSYDIISLMNNIHPTKYDETFKREMPWFPDGIYPCSVYGYKNNCTAYIWNTNGQMHGLIVDNNDSNAVSYASGQFNKKPIFI